SGICLTVKKIFVGDIKEDIEEGLKKKIFVGEAYQNKTWLILHPAKEVKIFLETSVVVMEVVLVGMATLVVEESSEVEVALVVAMDTVDVVMVVVDVVAVGIAVMDLVKMEAILDMFEATVTEINIQISDL
ncbi:hypothetical protein J0S82_008879, partial [Galemys pyrenaicus]